jgi:hypothetical protein
MLKQSFSFLLATPCGGILMNYFFLFFFVFWLNPAYYFEDYAMEGRWWKPERLIWKWLIYVGICVWINCIHVIFWPRRIGVWLCVSIDHIYVIFWSRRIYMGYSKFMWKIDISTNDFPKLYCICLWERVGSVNCTILFNFWKLNCAMFWTYCLC